MDFYESWKRRVSLEFFLLWASSFYMRRELTIFWMSISCFKVDIYLVSCVTFSLFYSFLNVPLSTLALTSSSSYLARYNYPWSSLILSSFTSTISFNSCLFRFYFAFSSLSSWHRAFKSTNWTEISWKTPSYLFVNWCCYLSYYLSCLWANSISLLYRWLSSYIFR